MKKWSASLLCLCTQTIFLPTYTIVSASYEGAFDGSLQFGIYNNS